MSRNSPQWRAKVLLPDPVYKACKRLKALYKMRAPSMLKVSDITFEDYISEGNYVPPKGLAKVEAQLAILRKEGCLE